MLRNTRGHAPVAKGRCKLFEEAGHPFANHGDALTAGRLRQGAAEPGLSDAARAGDDQIAPVGDPFAGEQALEQRLVEATARAVIDILRPGAHMAQPGGAHPGFEPLGLTADDLAVNQQAEPFSVTEIGGGVLNLQLGEGFGHPVKPQGLQVIERWVVRHCVSFQWK
jgi:hypothetical protein